MLSTLLGILAAIQVPAAQESPTPVPADAYADSATASLVARVRAARDRNERLVTSYSAVAKQRIGLGLRALHRDRMLYRSEIVARIGWQRDAPSTIEVIGAREGIPIALRSDRIPEELDELARDLVMNPAQDVLPLLARPAGEEGFVHPLRVGAEHDYRYRGGDTTTIRLPTGREIRIAALHVTPRRADWKLIAGTFWYDADTHGVVQAVFRPARSYEFRRDADADDRKNVPAFVNPTGEVKYVTIEYGLYEARWWMPRYIAIEAVGAMGSWLGVPFRIERSYEDYAVEGGTPRPPGVEFTPAGTRRQRREARAEAAADRAAEDSLRSAIDECLRRVEREMEGAEGRRRRAERRQCWAPEDSNLVVVIPADTLSLLDSRELGPPILAMGDLINEQELRGLADAIGQLPASPWSPRVDLPRGVTAWLQHARYNRIEALSLGRSARLDLGPASLTGLARIGLADGVLNGELTLARATRNTHVTLAGYRRLVAANPDTRPFGPVNSFLALVAQRDDGEYYRALGAEVTLQNANAGWWRLRAYWQRERPARVEASASLPRLFDETAQFRPNIAAAAAEQLGASLVFRGDRVLSRTVTLGGELAVDGATGDFDLGRGSATVRLFVTPAGPLAGALTASAGTSVGALPPQSRFYLGGAATLRGYPGGVMAGTAYWAGRVEVGNSLPGARLTAFADVGWAGDREAFSSGRPLLGAGVGASFLDGLVRLDLARGLRAPGGWRLEFYLDGLL